ncbi:MAG: hypothetical protein D8H96_01950 [Lautropia sp.]|nr:MAG: hypothetical protein D8H96_01950 [Lautropia sp.]
MAPSSPFVAAAPAAAPLVWARSTSTNEPSDSAPMAPVAGVMSTVPDVVSGSSRWQGELTLHEL